MHADRQTGRGYGPFRHEVAVCVGWVECVEGVNLRRHGQKSFREKAAQARQIRIAPSHAEPPHNDLPRSPARTRRRPRGRDGRGVDTSTIPPPARLPGETFRGAAKIIPQPPRRRPVTTSERPCCRGRHWCGNGRSTPTRSSRPWPGRARARRQWAYNLRQIASRHACPYRAYTHAVPRVMDLLPLYSELYPLLLGFMALSGLALPIMMWWSGRR